MRFLITGTLIILSFPSFTQTNNSLNLEKYWRYRERLKNFMVVSNTNTEGTNIPALALEMNSGNKAYLYWGDANANMSHYLSMLATEYRLLKNQGHNYQKTINELYTSLQVIDRLDLSSESYFRANGQIDGGDLNGWMIRDDVSEEFWNTYHTVLGMPAENSFMSMFIKPGENNKESISQDNIYHWLEGLALINSLVENEYVESPVAANVNFAAWSKDITRRLITMMYHSGSAIYKVSKKENRFSCSAEKPDWKQWIFSPDWALLQQTGYDFLCSIKSNWYIKNPVTNQLAQQGSGEEFDLWLFYCYGAAKAGNKILGTQELNLGPADDNLQREVFLSILDGSYKTSGGILAGAFTQLISQGIITFATASVGIPLPTNAIPTPVLNDMAFSMVQNSLTTDPYKVQALATVGNIGGSTTFTSLRDWRDTYGAFPLMYKILHGAPTTYSPTNSNYESDKTYYETILSAAPCSGPRNYHLFSGDDYNNEWSSASRLVWPENRMPSPIFQGYLGKQIEFNGLDYMVLHNLYCLAYGKDFRKLTVSSSEDLTNRNYAETAVDLIGKNIISGTSYVTYSASNSVKLIPGFKVVAGSTFNANIIPSVINYAGFSQLNICSNTLSGRLASNEDLENEKQTSSTIIENLTLDTDEEKIHISVYPNPSNGIFIIKLLPELTKSVEGLVSVSDLAGSIIYERKINEPLGTAITLPSIAKGVYIIKVVSEHKFYQSKLYIR